MRRSLADLCAAFVAIAFAIATPTVGAITTQAEQQPGVTIEKGGVDHASGLVEAKTIAKPTDAHKVRVLEFKLKVQQTATKAQAAQAAYAQAQLLSAQVVDENARQRAERAQLEGELLKALGAAQGCTLDFDAIVTICPDVARPPAELKQPQQ